MASESEQEKRETLADIVAEMKRTKYGGEDCSVKWCLREWADRIESAWRRERESVTSRNQFGNAAALREALEAVVAVGYPHNFQREAPHIREYCYDITEAIKKCFPALAAHARQCDVGTPEEQVARHHAYCNHMMKRNNHCCGPCPCYKFVNGEAQSCTLLWAQTPYAAQEGAEK